MSHAQPKPSKKRTPVTLSPAAPGTLGFTPSVADPNLAASLARGGTEKVFRFTPAGSPGSKKSVTVALRSRGVTKAEAAKSIVAGTEATAPSTRTEERRGGKECVSTCKSRGVPDT